MPLIQKASLLKTECFSVEVYRFLKKWKKNGEGEKNLILNIFH